MIRYFPLRYLVRNCFTILTRTLTIQSNDMISVRIYNNSDTQKPQILLDNKGKSGIYL